MALPHVGWGHRVLRGPALLQDGLMVSRRAEKRHRLMCANPFLDRAGSALLFAMTSGCHAMPTVVEDAPSRALLGMGRGGAGWLGAAGRRPPAHGNETRAANLALAITWGDSFPDAPDTPLGAKPTPSFLLGDTLTRHSSTSPGAAPIGDVPDVSYRADRSLGAWRVQSDGVDLVYRLRRSTRLGGHGKKRWWMRKTREGSNV
jgi:hypothetical protein